MPVPLAFVLGAHGAAWAWAAARSAAAARREGSAAELALAAAPTAPPQALARSDVAWAEPDAAPLRPAIVETSTFPADAAATAAPSLALVALCVALIALAPALRPAPIPEAVWLQLAALAALALLLWRAAPARPRAAAAAPAAPPPLAASAADAAAVGVLSGVWLKDRAASDAQEPAFELVRLPGLLRLAVGLIRGLEVRAEPGREFAFSVLSGVAWFKITERYPLGGGGGGAPPEEARQRRRDLRRGGAVGTAAPAPGGGVRLALRWDEPFAGGLVQRFHLSVQDPEVLLVDTTMAVGGAEVSYREVYRRQRA
jgi:hypothetical protein